LKSPAKNYNQLFDFAVAGPLFGIIASVVALYIGLQLTVGADASTSALFPALPLQILRQSSLGGGIIESVLGSGTLSIPNGASELVNSINIPLHPVAISGFFSLIVNTIALLPIGVTDGGRIAQAVFGREGKGFVGQVSLLALLGVGFFGDDLFLFYALFCLIFQLGTEIPIRNEVDSVSFVRVMFATGLGIVTLLSLIPIQ
jgi:membrane-associated protease RseP (regulator of RpoE activity)